MRRQQSLQCWLRSLLPTSIVATRQPNKLQHWQNGRSPSNVAMRRQSSLQYRQRQLWLTSNVTMRQPHVLWHWQNWHLPQGKVTTKRLLCRQETNAILCWQIRPTTLTQQSSAFGQNAISLLLLWMPSLPRLSTRTLHTMPWLRP
jgi:hypothetical protein